MIKAEEALKSFNYIQMDTEKGSVHKIHIDIISEFLKQNLTPTFDEVVKVWGDTSKEIGEDISVQKRDWGFFVTIGNQRLQITDDFLAIRSCFLLAKEVVNAINLTIRYLEGKKEKENGK